MVQYFQRVISASLSPNTELDDVFHALMMLLSPWKWRYGNELRHVARWLERYGSVTNVSLCNSGRSALFMILKAFDIGMHDEVIVQAFTCVAVPNSVLWVGATPVYADIDTTYNLDPNDVEKKITPQTKAIIVQHTFGVSANMDAILRLTKKYHILLIEDCAHALGAYYNGKALGTFGDAAFFSFGRDKVLSSVWGGAAMIKDTYTTQNEKLKALHKDLPMPNVFWIVQQLLHPIVFAYILPLYTIGFGKVSLVVFQMLRLLSFPVYGEEKLGIRPMDFPGRYPNALAGLLLLQLKKLDRYTRVRQTTAKKYTLALSSNARCSGLIFRPEASCLRYPVLVDNPESIRITAKKRGILLGNWYHNVIDPAGVNFRAVGYKVGSCPKAEETATHIVNLPTLIRPKDLNRVVAFMRTI